MQRLYFDNNFNGKLFLNCFGTVQIHDAEKHALGSSLEIYFKHQLLGIATVAAVRPFFYKHISDVLSYLDCGKPAHYLAEHIRQSNPKQEIKPDTMLDHVVLHYLRRNLNNHSTLLTEWWKDKVQQQKQAHEGIKQVTFNF